MTQKGLIPPTKAIYRLIISLYIVFEGAESLDLSHPFFIENPQETDMVSTYKTK